MSHSKTIKVSLTHQHLELLKSFIPVDNPSNEHYASLIIESIRAAEPYESSTYSAPIPSTPDREIVSSYVLEPGTGKALEVKKDHIIHIEQLVGGQIADFNVYNLHNRHERLHTGRTRIIYGNSPTVGNILWSNGPWERPLMVMLNNTSRTDSLYSACSAVLYSLFFGNRDHLNCQEIQAEAQREYSLHPYEVHDSLNLFQYVKFNEDSSAVITDNLSKKGDYIEFFALMDVLAIPNVCADDFGKSNNFWQNPLKVTIYKASQSDLDKASEFVSPIEKFILPVDASLADAPLSMDKDYVPSFPHLPLKIQEISVTLDDELSEKFESSRNYDLYGDDEGASARGILMCWVRERMDWSLDFAK